MLKPPKYFGTLTTIVKIFHSQPLFVNTKYFLPFFDNISTMKPLSIPSQHKHIIHKTLYNLQITHCFQEISIHIGKLCNIEIIIDAPLGLSSVIFSLPSTTAPPIDNGMWLFSSTCLVASPRRPLTLPSQPTDKQPSLIKMLRPVALQTTFWCHNITT